MLASYLHSLNRLAGRADDLQGLCQAVPESPRLLLAGLKPAQGLFLAG